jgi:hypothetical protein
VLVRAHRPTVEVPQIYTAVNSVLLIRCDPRTFPGLTTWFMHGLGQQTGPPEPWNNTRGTASYVVLYLRAAQYPLRRNCPPTYPRPAPRPDTPARADTPTRVSFRKTLPQDCCLLDPTSGKNHVPRRLLPGPNTADRRENDRPTDSSANSHGVFVHLRSGQDHSGPLPLPSHFHPKDRQMV